MLHSQPVAELTKPVSIQTHDNPRSLERVKAQIASGLHYAKELHELRDPSGDPERFIYRGILLVGLALVEDRIAGWGEVLVARPNYGEGSAARGYCRVSRLDVAPAYRRRRFADARSGQPISVVLLNALLKAAPYGSEVVAEVSPDAENLFEQVGFKLHDHGNWMYVG